MREVVILGVPIDLGAGRRGVDMGPSAIRYAGLQERLAQLEHPVRDLGNLSVPLLEQCPLPAPGTTLRYLEPIVQVVQRLAQQTAAIMRAGGFPLILGGDHSLSLGSIAGVADGRRLGVIWIDAHGDFNTDQTTRSGNIHGMPLAALTGRGHPDLTAPLGRRPVLHEPDVALIAVRDLDPLERQALRASGVHVFTMHDIDRRGLAAVMEQAITLVSRYTDGLHLSLDLDALDPREAPGVGTPVMGGISYREAHLAMELLAASGRLVSIDLVEVNPILDLQNVTANLAVAFALSALGQRIL
jgi:arginase